MRFVLFPHTLKGALLKSEIREFVAERTGQTLRESGHVTPV